MFEITTDKQINTVRTICKTDKKVNILYGTIRSGKTILSLIIWIIIIKLLSKKRGEIIMVGRTITSLYDNVLSPLKQEYGNYIDASRNRSTANIFGVTVLIRSASDESSEEKIRGLSVTAAYCDEIILYPNSFIKMLISRLSFDYSKMIGTTNTGSPSHYLYENVMVNPKFESKQIFFFEMDDNPHLSEEYKEMMRNTYSGLWYRRFCLGEWVSADGAIYDMFDKQVHVVDAIKETGGIDFVAIDYGIQNPCVFLLFKKVKDKYFIRKEYYWDGRAKQQQKTDSDYVNDLKKWLDGTPIKFVIVDPSATSFIVSLRRAGFIVKLAKNAVIEGIQCVSTLLSQNNLAIEKQCKETIKEFEGYIWDTKALDRGIEQPVKKNDHCVDAARYGIMTTYTKPTTNKKLGNMPTLNYDNFKGMI